MCGVAAIFAYNPVAPQIDRRELRVIRDYMRPRGPDAKGEWFSEDGRIGFGHRRLSIIDLTEKASQPMTSRDGRVTVSFNGEIYNYAQLRQRLEALGYAFRSCSDTEVLLHLYKEKGVGMLDDLRGMFAFVLWDDEKKALLMARDPYGIKPLYYADDGWVVRVASQVKALVAGGKVSGLPEPAGIAGFFLFGSVPEPYTIFQEVRAVPAGSYLWADETGVASPVPYFSIARVLSEAEEMKGDISRDESKNLVREALLDSVQHHLVADVPVGCFLSSGIDSTVIVALAKECGLENISTVTLGFSEFEGSLDDECPLAEEIGRYYHTIHATRFLDAREFQEDLTKVLESMDQPSIDGVNTYFVSKAAKELGWKVALSGLGGDELFGGYPSFHDIPKWVRSMFVPSRAPLLGDLTHLALRGVTKALGLNPKAAGIFKYGGSYPGAYLLKRGLFMPEELPQLMSEEMAREGMRRLKPLRYIAETMQGIQSPDFKVAAMESSLYMRNQLLRDADWAGMAHSLEIRTPLVDAHLLKRLAPMLAVWSGKGKEPLAMAARPDLPEQIRNRPKTGFAIPVENWLENDRRFDAWKGVPLLRAKNCPPSRRWAFQVAHVSGLVT
ncbi:asparagine synthase (glutamine-hydrolyzing) [Candidatus Parcubacteria bacterium]|nr:MAG: asparagine synthase (glutamine-hydrolyzing) [Candidatus Parcubacteria bacterium]